MKYDRPFPWRMLLCFLIGVFSSLRAFSQGQTLDSFEMYPSDQGSGQSHVHVMHDMKTNM